MGELILNFLVELAGFLPDVCLVLHCIHTPVSRIAGCKYLYNMNFFFYNDVVTVKFITTY